MTSVLKNRKVMFAVACFLILGVAPLMFKGLQYGMDFSGGTLIQINLDLTKNESIDTQTVVTVLQNRINSFGLKDVSIKPWGNPVTYIIVEVAETDPAAINEIQSIIGQQGKFETMFEGNVILSGKDVISVLTDPQQGYGMRTATSGVEWSVPFLVSAEGADAMAKSIEGKCSTPQLENCPETLYMFIDRPENAVIVMPNELANAEQTIPESLSKSDAGTTGVALEDLVKNSGGELIISSTVTADVLNKTAGKTVIVPPGYYNESDFSTADKVVVKQKISDYWTVDALNLDNIIHLTPGVTAGKPITRPLITGNAATPAEAKKEMERVVILLKSGKLPVSVSVGSVSTISPALGSEFLTYSVYAGIIAMAVVAVCLFVRYRKPKVTTPILITLVFEITMTLGIASLIGWQMDLPSVAGIIAAIGTGIDDQIVIVDEVRRKEKDEDDVTSVASKIKRAFSIVFMSAGLHIFAMLPLLFMGLGVLKGFAITTIIGVIVGVFVTRPAYGAIVDKYAA
ncbi:MMPL family transporter [Candidatus Micrarchaeota archaeon]|nr:MMPL family transporter [Candidatus Micrarchaeota archaeon]